ncbi:putative replication factor-a protein [Spironucleus salmonicida]|uniref:Replication factor-a protein n=1 Tax=Spironucleus salmonicida TaxID=348837 RepID=V6LNB5_9EUKA|nr:putative replication factor-a protein [Spironucleus salmonicida]|eukprot:EST45723.1 Putative replication factor-a protein [Spironucleus salmonicida]
MSTKITPISNLLDFGQFTFQGIITQRRPIAFTKANKPWFSFTIDDGDCDIKVSVFNNAEQFDSLILEGSQVKISNSIIRLKTEMSKKYDRSKSDYEVSFKDATQVETLGQGNIMYTAQSIRDVKESIEQKIQQNPDATDSVKLLVKVISVNHNSGASWENLNLTIADQDDSSKLTIWLRDNANFGLSAESVTTLKDQCIGLVNIIVKNSKYGIQFSTTQQSQIILEKDLQSKFTNSSEFVAQKDQIISLNMSQNTGPQSPGRQLASSEYQPLSELSLNFQKSLISLTFMNDVERALYKGCSKCKKKAEQQLLCGCEDAEIKYYYKLSGVASDYSGTARVTLFDPYASNLLQMTADEFVELPVENREKLLLQAFEASCLMKQVTSNVENREKVIISGVDQKIDYWGILGGACKSLVLQDGEGVTLQ